MMAGEYSPIKHYAYSVFLNHNPKERFIAMFTAYFDASGSNADPGINCVTVSGFISNVYKWLKFEREWKKVLRRDEISFFHMRDFMSNSGDYRNWKRNDAKRERHLSDLIDITLRYTYKSITHTVPLAVYNAANQRYEIKARIGNPYTLASIACIHATQIWGEDNKCSHPIEYFFEEGDAGQGQLLEICRGGGLPMPRIRGKHEPKMVPFQACDLAAWLHREMVTELDRGVFSGLRNGTKALIQQRDAEYDKVDATIIDWFCNDLGIPLRKKAIRAARG